MTAPALSSIRACLEGSIPAVLATCGTDGLPNVAYISQVFYVDDRHVALSFQFFNKTRQNILANPHATALLLHPLTAAFYRLRIRYLRTESEGPVFESMKAQLAGIASYSGMQDVFRLLGSDIYEVQAIESVPGEPLPAPPAAGGHLAAVRRCSERLARSTTLAEALDAALCVLGEQLGMQHAMVLMLDEPQQRLYTVASAGYATSGVGSEIRIGQGVVGVAARERTPVRISHMTQAASYSQAMRTSFERNVPDLEPLLEIPYPGLAQPHSQIAVPMLSAGRLLGVVFAESPRDLQFGYEEEDALVAIAGPAGRGGRWDRTAARSSPPPPSGPPRATPGCARTARSPRGRSSAECGPAPRTGGPGSRSTPGASPPRPAGVAPPSPRPAAARPGRRARCAAPSRPASVCDS